MTTFLNAAQADLGILEVIRELGYAYVFVQGALEGIVNLLAGQIVGGEA